MVGARDRPGSGLAGLIYAFIRTFTLHGPPPACESPEKSPIFRALAIKMGVVAGRSPGRCPEKKKELTGEQGRVGRCNCCREWGGQEHGRRGPEVLRGRRRSRRVQWREDRSVGLLVLRACQPQGSHRS